MKFSEKYRSLYFQRKFSLLVFLNFHKSLNKEINWNALRFIILCIKTPLKMQSILEGLMLKLQYFSCDANSWLIGKVPDTGKDWGQKKRASEDEMAGWHHRCNGHELRQSSGDGEGQGSLSCCSPWGCKELDTTGWLKNNNTTLVLGLCTLKAQSSAFKILTLLLVIAPFKISKSVLFPCC